MGRPFTVVSLLDLFSATLPNDGIAELHNLYCGCLEYEPIAIVIQEGGLWSVARLTVTFEGKAAETLDRLAADRGSRAGVLRDALALEQEYLDAVKRGADFVIVERHGTMSRLVRL